MQQTSPSDTRNVILAAVLSFAVFILWQQLVVNPEIEAQQAAEVERLEQQEAALEAGGFELDEDAAGPQPMTREEALGEAGRIEIDTPTLGGSLTLTGGAIDALDLHDYRVAVDPDSADVELLHPSAVDDAYFAVFGWGAAGGVPTPGPSTQWALAPGSSDRLTPETPVTLIWDNGDGLVFTRRIEIDERYLFTVTQTVENLSDAEVTLRPVGRIERHGLPELENFFVLHEGAVGAFDGTVYEHDYDDLEDAAQVDGGRRGESYDVQSIGWLGFTDKYWMTVLAPADGEPFEATWDSGVGVFGETVYRAIVRMEPRVVSPGESSVVVTHFFAGAKEMSAIRDYQYLFDGAEEPESTLGRISDFFFYSSPSRFVDSIDWGWFFFLTKPIFEMLTALNGWVGNMGVAIILLTLVFKTLVFPLAYKSYVSMAAMKKLQPDMKKIQERFGEDRQRMQQEMMALYKREKVNPAAGCLPILVQIPIFFSLYKVLFVTLETRHAPFFGWIQDLSAPDPTSLFNLFGLLPYEVPAFLLIGIWPVLMGVTMWLQMMLNPAPTDPVQARIFGLMPLLFTFLLGTFASGLVIYWTANNVLTIMQQALIMRSQGVDIDFVGNIRMQLGLKERPKPETPSSTEKPAREADAAESEAQPASVDAGADADEADSHGDAPGSESETERQSGDGQQPSARRGGSKRGRGKRSQNRRR